MLIAALSIICPSSDEWILKMWYIHNRIYFSHKKKQIPMETWINFENIMLDEIFQKNYIVFH